MKMLKQWKRKSILLFLAFGCVLGGCGEKPEGAVPGSLQPTNIPGNQNNGQQGSAGTEGIQGNGQQETAGVEGTQGSGQQGTAIPEGQILDQSFVVTLDGWGEVTFASFEPEYDTKINEEGEFEYGGVRFMLLKDGEAIYKFPGFDKDNIRWYVQDFQQVTAVAFKDYNEDGRMDVLVITESVYVGDDPEPSCEARAYTQEEGSKEFVMDMPVTEYLWENRADNMEAVNKALEAYSQNYNVCTSKTAWDVERFARMVKTQILNSDFEGLAQEIAYPITVDGITYQDSAAFLQGAFAGNLNPEILAELEGESCQRMFANWQGIMLGNGCVWIGETLDENRVSQGLKVIGLNRLTDSAQVSKSSI